MYAEKSVLMVLLALSTLILGTLSLVAWRRRQSPLGQDFFLLIFLTTIYTFGYTFEFASSTLEKVRFWLHVESIGIAFIPTAWVIFAVRFTKSKLRCWPQMKALFLMLSAITFIISNTSELHQLHYVDMRLNSEAPFPVVNFVAGPWYWFHNVFTNVAVVIGNILYARAWKNTSEDKKQQAFAIFLGSMFPWVVFIAYMLKIIPWGIDPVPVAFLVPGLLYAWAVFDLKMLEIAPIARQAVFQKLSEGVFVFDRDGCLVDFNAAGCKVFPKLKNDAKGKNGSELFRDYPILLNLIADSINEQETMTLQAGDQKSTYQLQRIELYNRNHTVGFMVICRDITHFSNIVESLQLQAAIDPLTKAWNRNRWQEDGKALLAQACRNHGSIAIILTDLDKFKQVNDIYGHIIGDAALRNFALTCQNNLRGQDIFGRYGGDEFIIILPDSNTPEAVELAERLKRAVKSMILVAGERKITVTASFGIVSMQNEVSIDFETLINYADEALYEAKKAGGNQVYVFNTKSGVELSTPGNPGIVEH